jgi:predicted ATP-dependent endonuclease of OLD family
LQSRSNDWAIRFQRFAVIGLPGIGTLEVPIQSALTVFSGPNGVGKTTLLRAMWAALDPETSTSTISANRKLLAGSALVDFTVRGVATTAEVIFSDAGPTVVGRSAVTVHHIDSAALTPIHQKSFCRFESVDEIINGAGARELDDQMLSEVNYIVNRQYRAIKLYEVELDITVPFFEVSYGNDQYDSRTMGAGEIAALYIWWALSRAERDTVVLIEEPEAFLSFGSQKSLANFIVSSVVQKRLVAVLSSHSAAFISLLPKECLAFFARTPTGVIPNRAEADSRGFPTRSEM